MPKFTSGSLTLLFGICMLALPASGQVVPLGDLSRMPIKEITVFKDGHAFVVHEGQMRTDDTGSVVMDYLPTPMLGAFWPYSADQNVKLTAVTASRQIVSVGRTALKLRDMLEANIGSDVVILESPRTERELGLKYEATIISLPQRSSEELQRTGPPDANPSLPVKGDIILLKTAEGIKATMIDRIAEVTFKGEYTSIAKKEEFRNSLRLKLSGAGSAKPVNVGMMYVQKGIRWIPSYKVVVDGKGGATVKLQATLINELADLEDVTVNMVIGVPTFAFEDQIDPVAMQQNLASLSGYFRQDSRTLRLSNAIMTQVTLADSPVSSRRADMGPEIGPSARAEDLFVFTVNHLSLKKSERMVVPIVEFKVNYRDVYTLEIPYTPPPEIWRNISTEQQESLAALLSAPKVMHKLRITNNSKYPLTTAPALVVSDGRVLAQGMMTYTPVGAEVDLDVTTAVDIAVRKTDREIKRVHNAATWENNTYARIDLEGTIKLTNRKDRDVELEVTRYVLGNAETADHDGKIEMVNVLEGDTLGLAGRPNWWGWYRWPHWWGHFNGMGRIVWKFKLDAGSDVELKYSWNYYWR